MLTTPCANPGSLEWVLNRRRGGLQRTADGYGRFATDEPGHLRRLTSRDLRVLLRAPGSWSIASISAHSSSRR